MNLVDLMDLMDLMDLVVFSPRHSRSGGPAMLSCPFSTMVSRAGKMLQALAHAVDVEGRWNSASSSLVLDDRLLGMSRAA